jgi:membrane-bound lytic murein transglycosylase D
MASRSLLRLAAALTIGTVASSCAPRLSQQPPVTVAAPATRPTPIPKPAPPPPDPVAELIATSQQHFEAGQRELHLGHLERAKAEFNLSVDMLLESPFGARTDPRMREHFDSLIDRISTYEMTALAEGDGFTEKTYQAASIDELLELSTFEHPAPSPALQQTVRTDLEKTEHDIPIPLNSQVLSYIDLFQGQLRDWIQDGLRRGARYLPMIQSVFRAEGLPLDLAYVPLIESAFKPDAVSRAKAKGVWQFVKGTALANGLKQNWYVDERSDPEKATVAAAQYLKTLYGLFDGDWCLALASYNGGPSRVQRAISRSHMDDFWSLAEDPGLLPRETREYVPMILAAIVIARNPQQYGFEFKAAAAPAYETVNVTRPVDLRRVAEWAGVSASEIQSLNPELRRWTTPVKPPEYELRVPPGTAEVVQEKLSTAEGLSLATLNMYSVKRGDSLSSIARRYGVSRTELASANDMSASARLSIGQKLVIPRESTVLLAARADRPAPPASSRAAAESKPEPARPAAVTAANASAPGVSKTIYKVKSGDTLFSIARLYNTTVQALKSWNRLRSNLIRAGDRLTVFTRRPVPALDGDQ